MKAAKLLTLGNRCKHHCSRLIAVLSAERLLKRSFMTLLSIKRNTIMSERDKQIEKERKGVVELLLKKNGLTRKQLVDNLVDFWATSWAHTLTEEEKKQFPHLVF